MSYTDDIIKLLNKIYRTCVFTRDWLTPVGNLLEYLQEKMDEFHNNFFFDELDEEGCEFFEKLLGITVVEGETLEQRRQVIQYYYIKHKKNSLDLIQTIFNEWCAEPVTVDFIDGKICLNFKRTHVPDNLDMLLALVEEVKPAHIPIYMRTAQLLIEDIHEVMTVEELENVIIESFEFD